jgi:lysozyme
MGERIKVKFQKESKKEIRIRRRRAIFYLSGISLLMVAFFITYSFHLVSFNFLKLNIADRLKNTEIAKPIVIKGFDSNASHKTEVLNSSSTINRNDSAASTQKDNIRLLKYKHILDDSISGYYGINVSEWQHSVNWEEVFVKNELYPIKFVFIKATTGINNIDSKFKINWNIKRPPGVLFGAFHTYKNGLDPIQQADNYISFVSLTRGNLLPIVDVGLNNREGKEVMDPKLFCSNLSKFLQRIEENFGEKPIIYTCLDFYKKHLQRDFSHYKYWIAQYSESPPEGLILSNGKGSKINPDVAIWQYSYKGEITGITTNVCMNFLPEENLDSIMYTEGR